MAITHYGFEAYAPDLDLANIEVKLHVGQYVYGHTEVTAKFYGRGGPTKPVMDQLARALGSPDAKRLHTVLTILKDHTATPESRIRAALELR